MARRLNNRQQPDSSPNQLVEIKLVRGSEGVTLADSSTESVNVGQTTSLSCINADDYDAISINDSF